ncbi:Os10g0362000 [Oryza sativa Japonica Group]|uniref:Os10g0362000 protein n=2 Tax=Oryza sativa subsp. japonica TaxID=39947 RepID=C7J7Q0_ORYSJ|nr:putative receptor kinase-like protein [Oryza sativa Japonica Group]AAP53310.1 Leucine Rich Repeat family protein, expressed [Oryza sativa Japonica Group]BAH94838.1 Os10g0362000 [Oryza sativa Japonica Group]|eukprot:NP_001176110.1 Os10g0362000 [Oryza sativa Japonica Group]
MPRQHLSISPLLLSLLCFSFSVQASRPEGRRSVGRARRTLHEVGRGGGVVVAGRAVSAQFATAGADLSSGAAAAASAAGRRCTSPTSHRARARSGCAPSSPGSGSSRAAVQLRRVSRGCALFVYRAAEGASSTPTPPEEQTTRAAAAAVASPLPALNLTNRGLIGQMSPLGNLTFLKFLFVPANSFTGEIPQSFGNMHHLQIIYLSNNTLQRRMPNLANCSNLKVLWLNGNNLVGQIPADLPQRFQSLQLSVNSLTGPIPVSVAKITTLKRFSCLYNNIDGSIPNDFAKLPGLVYLHLGAKIIGRQCAKFFWKPFHSTAVHTLIHMGLNQFLGSIPSGIANIPNLIALELGGNLFTNVIPRSGGGMRGLLFQAG